MGGGQYFCQDFVYSFSYNAVCQVSAFYYVWVWSKSLCGGWWVGVETNYSVKLKL